MGCLFMFAVVWGEPASKSVYCLLESIPYSRSQVPPRFLPCRESLGGILYTEEPNKFVPGFHPLQTLFVKQARIKLPKKTKMPNSAGSNGTQVMKVQLDKYLINTRPLYLGVAPRLYSGLVSIPDPCIGGNPRPLGGGFS